VEDADIDIEVVAMVNKAAKVIDEVPTSSSSQGQTSCASQLSSMSTHETTATASSTLTSTSEETRSGVVGLPMNELCL
jgi:EREBP-like factor